MKRLKTFGFLFAASLSVAALQAQTLVYEGCWSPYPNCAGASDIYRDSSGRLWDCGRCGTTSNPDPATCHQVGNLYVIGYWCS